MTDSMRDRLRDELTAWPISAGYFSTAVSADDARDMADAVLAVLAEPGREYQTHALIHQSILHQSGTFDAAEMVAHGLGMARWQAELDEAKRAALAIQLAEVRSVVESPDISSKDLRRHIISILDLGAAFLDDETRSIDRQLRTYLHGKDHE